MLMVVNRKDVCSLLDQEDYGFQLVSIPASMSFVNKTMQAREP
jgi:hypothetical protein